MAYYRVSEATDAFRRTASGLANLRTAESLLKSASRSAEGQSFDIFLSHSFRDATLILGVKTLLEEQGWSVYVDWIDDVELDRSKVNKATAKRLRERMRASKSLIFATSPSTPTSKWMPWELGYFDGFRAGRVAILPLVESSDSEYQGQEYLGLYPTIEKLRSKGQQQLSYVTKGVRSNRYKTMTAFTQGERGYKERL
jgi:hypothetical protein